MIGPNDRGFAVVPVEPGRNHSFFFTSIFATDHKRLDPAVSWNKLIDFVPAVNKKPPTEAGDLIHQERSAWRFKPRLGKDRSSCGTVGSTYKAGLKRRHDFLTRNNGRPSSPVCQQGLVSLDRSLGVRMQIEAPISSMRPVKVVTCSLRSSS